MSQIFITGGAGYIGSHVCKLLLVQGYDTVVIDNLSRGHMEAVKVLEGLGGKFKFYKVDLADQSALDDIFKNHNFDAVLHFAGFIEAGESMKYPGRFFRNNVCNGVNLLEAMIKAGTEKIIFSSTAAVYESPIAQKRIKETDKLNPANNYGVTKLTFERMLSCYEKTYGLKYVILRYFNAAGADPDGELGERHNPETHLIPRVIQAALGQRKQAEIYGTDYPTKDGTCIRDYIHVNDLADAHILALEYLLEGGESNVYNLGSGSGYSVREVVDAVRRISGKDFKITENPRRKGDAAFLVADSSRIKKELSWKPKYPQLEEMVESTLGFYENL